jgi:hypothetical protein
VDIGVSVSTPPRSKLGGAVQVSLLEAGGWLRLGLRGCWRVRHAPFYAWLIKTITQDKTSATSKIAANRNATFQG